MTTSVKPIRILVVDDHFMVRMGLTASLNAEPDMEVVAEVGSGEAALEAYNRTRPNLVIMDVRLPGMDGVAATAAILREFPDAGILMLSTHAGEEEIYRAMQAGARGYVLKSVLREDLLRAIREVHAGRRHLDPIVASHLAERLSHRSLTARELEVLRMVAKGGQQGDRECAQHRGGDRQTSCEPCARETERQRPDRGGDHRRAKRNHFARLTKIAAAIAPQILSTVSDHAKRLMSISNVFTSGSCGYIFW